MRLLRQRPPLTPPPGIPPRADAAGPSARPAVWPAVVAVASWLFCAGVLVRTMMGAGTGVETARAGTGGGGPGVCAFKAVTGLLLKDGGAPCPYCGCSRSLAALASGDAQAAFRLHPLSVPIALLFTWCVGTLAAQAWHGRPLRLGRPIVAAWIVLSAAAWAAQLLSPLAYR